MNRHITDIGFRLYVLTNIPRQYGRLAEPPLRSITLILHLAEPPLRILAVIGVMAMASGCGFYSLTGASIPDDIQTVAIPLADLDAATPVSTLADDLTRLVIDRMVRQTRLDLETDEADADAVLTMRITQYRASPAALASDDRAQLTRVSISVQARYARQGSDEPIFDRAFQGNADYDPVAVGPSGEIDAAAIALAEIADDVFTAATSNW